LGRVVAWASIAAILGDTIMARPVPRSGPRRAPHPPELQAACCDEAAENAIGEAADDDEIRFGCQGRVQGQADAGRVLDEEQRDDEDERQPASGALPRV